MHGSEGGGTELNRSFLPLSSLRDYLSRHPGPADTALARNRSFGSRRVLEVLDPGQVLVEPGKLVDHRLNRERCFDMFAPGCAQTAGKVGIADDVANCPGQKLRVGHWDEDPGLAVDHDLGGSGCRCGNHGLAESHGLEHEDEHALVSAEHDNEVSGGH